MEQCPRCGTDLDSITMFGKTARFCERCGYADVPTSLEGEREDVESWNDALKRFYDEHRD